MIPRSALLRQRATIIRNPGSRSAFGEWVPGTPVEVEVGCVSQPDTGEQRVLDDTGSRIRRDADLVVRGFGRRAG